MVPQLRLNLLGGFSITIAGQPVTELTSRKAQALLCYLAVTDRSYTRTALAGVFWPDVPEANARMNLRKELTRLRKTVAPYLRIERESIAIDPKADVWVDAVVFMKLVEQIAETALASSTPVTNGTPPAAAQQGPLFTQQLHEVTALYGGDFLNGFSILHAPPFEKWVLLQQSQLRGGMIQALETLAERANQQRKFAQAIAITKQLLALEPWWEAAHRQLMQLLAWQGDRGAALAQYEICQQRLADELDVEPEQATVTLYEQIRDGAVGQVLAERPVRSQAMRPADSPPTDGLSADSLSTDSLSVDNPSINNPPTDNLPAQFTPLIGREEELGAVAQLLADPAVRLVTILGPGGMGKSRLAVEVAASTKGAYQHGAYLVALAPLSDPASIVTAIAAAIGYSFYSDGRSEEQEIIEYLHEKQMLLVLDNAEHLLAGVDYLVEILHAAPAVHMLVTSRERLRLSGETVFQLAGLPVAETAHTTDIGEPEDGAVDSGAAGQLFLQTARRVHQDFRLTAADLAAIGEVCRLVGGMPLGLILAASWCEMLTPAEIATEIRQGLDFLAVDLRDLPERQRSMAAVFETTWQRLSPREQGAFMQLAIFRGGFTREAAHAVTGTTLVTLTRLNHKSLLQRNANGRYEIHELLRQFATNRLANYADIVYDAHSAYYCARLQQRKDDLRGRRQQEALEEIEADNENIRLAWQWAVKSRALHRLAAALDSWGLFHLWQSRFHDGLALCQQAVDAIFSASTASVSTSFGQEVSQPGYSSRTLHRSDWIRFEIRLRIWLSTFHRHLMETESARQTIRSTHPLLTDTSVADVDLRFEQALLLLEEAELDVLAQVGANPQQNQGLIEQSLALFRLLDERWYMSQALSLLSEVLQRHGSLQQAKVAGEEGLTLRRALGDKRGMANSLGRFAIIFQKMGKFDEAERCARQSIAISTEIKDQRHLANGLSALSRAMLHGGKFAECLGQVQEIVRIHHQLELPMRPGFPTIIVGFASMHLGRYREVQEQMRQALLEQNQIIDEVERFFAGSWPPDHLRPKWPKPRATIAQPLPDIPQQSLGYYWKDLGRTELALGMDDKAYQYLEEATRLFRQVTDFNGLGQVLGCLGFLAYKHQAYEQALAYFAENLEIAINSRLFLPSLTALCGVALWCTVSDNTVSGNLEGAIELYTLAQQHRHVANSRWFADVVGSHITAATATMSPQAFAKAEARGRQRELFATIKELDLPCLSVASAFSL